MQGVEKVNELVNQAAAAESTGQYGIASVKYREAAMELLKLSRDVSLDMETVQLYTARAGEYLARSTELDVPTVVEPIPVTAFAQDADDSSTGMLGFTQEELRKGAAVAGAFGGILIGGFLCLPWIISAPLGAGYTVHCLNKQTKNGDRARRASVCGAKFVRRAKSFDEKHQVTKRISNAFKAAMEELTKENPASAAPPQQTKPSYVPPSAPPTLNRPAGQ